jgi:uncharacterized protein (DUF305 family)
MCRPQFLGTLAFVAAAVSLGACGSTGSTRHGDAPEPAGPAAAAELEELFWSRQDSARTRYTEADVRFIAGMIGHHAQAIVMARLAPTHGASRAIQTLAGRIINAQQDEISLMQQWLRDRDQPVPEVHISGLHLMVHGSDHGVHMPGMLTDEELRRLDAVRGREFDRLFLTFMIKHHQGAVEMVDELIATDGAAQDQAVFKLASDIQVDQRTEIARMELMLAQMAAGEGTP